MNKYASLASYRCPWLHDLFEPRKTDRSHDLKQRYMTSLVSPYPSSLIVEIKKYYVVKRKNLSQFWFRSFLWAGVFAAGAKISVACCLLWMRYMSTDGNPLLLWLEMINKPCIRVALLKQSWLIMTCSVHTSRCRPLCSEPYITAYKILV